MLVSVDLLAFSAAATPPQLEMEEHEDEDMKMTCVGEGNAKLEHWRVGGAEDGTSLGKMGAEYDMPPLALGGLGPSLIHQRDCRCCSSFYHIVFLTDPLNVWLPHHHAK